MLRIFTLVLRREMISAFRQWNDLWAIVMLFAVFAAIVPLGVGSDPERLRFVAPGAIWMAALLVSLLGVNRLFSSDYADGTLDQWMLSGEPLEIIVLCKILAHWILTGLPLVPVALLAGILFGLDLATTPLIAISLLIGTPILSTFGAIGAALTLGIRGGSVLVSIITLPLYVPALIFGAGAVEQAIAGEGGVAHLLILAALALIAFALGPWATAAALRAANS